MEQQISFVLKLSLKEMATRRVAINLWNETDILSEIEKFKFNSFRDDDYNIYKREITENKDIKYNEWEVTVESKVADKVLRMFPRSLNKQMLDTIEPIGFQIRWKRFHEIFLSDSRQELDLCILKKLFWTSTGQIDYQKTARELLKLQIFESEQRYKLACLYCLVDYIPVFWFGLSEDSKSCFLNEDIFQAREYTYFAYVVEEKEYEMDLIFQSFNSSLNFHFFYFSAIKGNKVAVEYFSQKLTSEEKETSLIRAVRELLAVRSREDCRKPWQFPIEKLSDVLFYLLSLMSLENQIQVLKENPCDVFKCFLDWPWQDHFFDISDVFWTFLPEDNYDKLLFNINDQC